MPLLWHLIKNDLRQARWSLLAWSLSQALVILVSLSLWYTPAFFIERTTLLQPLLGLATFALLFTAYDFGVRIIQSDNPSVAHAFWRARPISPFRLLTAKLLTILASTLLTALPSASIFLAHRIIEGVPVITLLPVAVLLVQLPFLLVAVLFAAFTPSTRHCLLATVLAFVGCTIWASVSITRLADADAGLATARFYATAIIFALTAVLAIAHQYRTGRFARSLVTLGLGVTAAFTTPLWFHGRVSSHETIPSKTESALTREITPRQAKLAHVENARRTARASFFCQTTFTGIPPGHLLLIDSVRQHWPHHNLTAEQSQSQDKQIPVLSARAALTGDTFTAAESLHYRVALPRDEAAALKAADAVTNFSAECTLSLVHPEIAFTLPLRDPSHSLVKHRNGLAKVVAIEATGNAFWISTLPTPSPRTEDSRGYTLQLGSSSHNRPIYFLRHRPSGKITHLYASTSISGMGATLTQFTLGDDAPGKPSAQWLEESDLVQVTHRQVARFTRHVSATKPPSP
jgi:hypothetical protein